MRNHRAVPAWGPVAEDRFDSKEGTAPVRWGLIGAGAIARDVIAPALHASSHATIRVVGARDYDRAASLGPQVAVTRYEQVLDDPLVEVVYISLHNSAHAYWCAEALSHGKHVLCEKPLATTPSAVADLEEQALQTGLLLVEALWMRWHPRMRTLFDMARDVMSGDNVHVEAVFQAPAPPVGNYRWDSSLGGGALLDLGGYVVGAVLELFGWDAPEVRGVEARCWPPGADAMTQADLYFPGYKAAGGEQAGRKGSVSLRVSLDGAAGEAATQRLVVSSESGMLLCSPPVFTSRNTPSEVVWLGDGAPPVRYSYEACDPYQEMLEAMSAAVRGEDVWRMPLSESRMLAQTIQAIAARSG